MVAFRNACDRSLIEMKSYVAPGITAALRMHGETSAAIAGGAFLCIVEISTYVDQEFQRANGGLFEVAECCRGSMLSCTALYCHSAK